jgi:lipopolysaccharide export system permease protein
MLACGVSWQKLTMVALSLGIVVMVLAGILTCYSNPRLAHFREQLLQKEGPLFLIQTLNPGRFHTFHKDKLVFYVAGVNSDRSELKQIFIAEQPQGIAKEQDQWSVISAHRGSIFKEGQSGLTYIKLFNGRRYNGTPGESDYSILQFAEYQRLLENPATVQEGLYFHRTMPTKMLIENPTKGNLAELQWRLSIPLSTLLLALLAVPLSRVSPRKGRFGSLFIAIVICIVYYNLLTVSKRWVGAGVIPPVVGVWWVHLLLLGLGLGLLGRASGRWQQLYHYLKKTLYKPSDPSYA